MIQAQRTLRELMVSGDVFQLVNIRLFGRREGASIQAIRISEY